MKKVLKVFIVFICLVMLFGCKKDEEPISETPNNEKEDLKANISFEEMGVFDGEFSEKLALLKITNNNDRAVYVNVLFRLYDQNKNDTNSRDVYVRVGAKSNSYALVRQDFEEPKFYSYDYTFDVSIEKLENYEDTYKNVSVDYNDNGNNIVVIFKNNGVNVTSAYAYVFFYKNNNIVAISDANAYNLMPMSTRNVEIRYPLKTASENKAFDRVSVFLNEVSTEL